MLENPIEVGATSFPQFQIHNYPAGMNTGKEPSSMPRLVLILLEVS